MREINEAGERPGIKLIFVRLVFVLLGLAAWFGTQNLLATRPFPEGVVGDGIFDITAPLNDFLNAHPTAADALLVVSSLVIDLVSAYILFWAIIGPSIRPFLGLLILFGLRQFCQALCALPAPEHMIWRYPGFPSALVTYGTASDLFFSGHTALAVYGALELSRRQGVAWKYLGVLIAVFEASTVLVLRAHYTMDVFTGILAAIWVNSFIDRVTIPVDRALQKLV